MKEVKFVPQREVFSVRLYPNKVPDVKNAIGSYLDAHGYDINHNSKCESPSSISYNVVDKVTRLPLGHMKIEMLPDNSRVTRIFV